MSMSSWPTGHIDWDYFLSFLKLCLIFWYIERAYGTFEFLNHVPDPIIRNTLSLYLVFTRCSIILLVSMLVEGLELGHTQEQALLNAKVRISVMMYIFLLIIRISGGSHDIWGDLHEEEADFRGIREQETEVILAFTLLITILLSFIG